MTLAIFDLDETLIDIDSDHAWGEFICDEGMVDAEEHRRKNNGFYADYQAGQLDVTAYLAFACRVLTQYSLDELHRAREKFVTDRIVSHLLPRAKNLIARHRSAGHELLIITSTIEFITRPIADRLGIDTLIAPMPEMIDGRYTGAITGTPSFGPGKVTCLAGWLRANPGFSMADSYFYSDSRNDLPLLEAVEHPVAVNPDPVLAGIAKERGWTVLSLR